MKKMLSTSSLAKKHSISAKELFGYFAKNGFIEKRDDSWLLSDKGKAIGGEYRESKQYGKYIVWPENIQLDLGVNEKFLSATAIGKHFSLSANKMNFILSEIGWIEKGLKGWKVTIQGEKQGGVQAEDPRSGIPFVRWPEKILESKTLLETISQVKGTQENTQDKENPSQKVDFREKFEAKHRSADGHFVRSKAEMLIDNWLYMAEIVHAYERKLPIEEDVYSDFYIPTGKVYIEYWGYENDEKYLARKKKKIEIYKKYGFNLIELNDKDVQNLDDVLPRMLLKYGVRAY